jgi:hypothetical protein
MKVNVVIQNGRRQFPSLFRLPFLKRESRNAKFETRKWPDEPMTRWIDHQSQITNRKSPIENDPMNR